MCTRLRYFYASVVRAFSVHLNYEIDQRFHDLPAIRVMAYPNLDLPQWRQWDFVQLGVAGILADQVRADSVPHGMDFDLEFVCASSCRAFSRTQITSLLDEPRNRSVQSDEDCDNWLSGFNTNQ